MKTLTTLAVLLLLQSSSKSAAKLRLALQRNMIRHF
jgi:hypothetical protein